MAKQKALTKEDLMYILQSIFHLSDEPNNAFKMLNDGLYVQDYHNDLQNSNDNLQNHIDDTNVHISNIRKKIKDYTDEEIIETVWGIGFKLKQ